MRARTCYINYHGYQKLLGYFTAYKVHVHQIAFLNEEKKVNNKNMRKRKRGNHMHKSLRTGSYRGQAV